VREGDKNKMKRQDKSREKLTLNVSGAFQDQVWDNKQEEPRHRTGYHCKGEENREASPRQGKQEEPHQEPDPHVTEKWKPPTPCTAVNKSL
jgi:hypothetical protein